MGFYSDFDRFSTGTPYIILNESSPLSGTQDVRIAAPAGGIKGALIVRKTLRGYTRAKLRCIWNSGLTNNSRGVALTCMHSVANITSSSNFYMLRATSNQFTIRKITGGTITTSGTQLAVESFTFSSSVTYAIEFEWYLLNSGTIDLIGRRFTGTDFSQLVETLSVNDASSPFTVTAGEGIGATDFGSGAAFDFRVDTASLIRKT
jgi:hypothetical protein